MSRSVLLQLARDSIEEVFHAKRSIDKTTLLKQHPLLNEKIPTTINLYINKELKSTYTTLNPFLIISYYLQKKLPLKTVKKML